VHANGTHGQDITWRLHLRKLGETTDRVIDTTQGQALAPSRGIATDGDHVIWNRPQGPTLLYTISTGSTQTLSPLSTVQPHILGNNVVWTALTLGVPVGQARTWGIQTLTLPSGAPTAPRPPRPQ